MYRHVSEKDLLFELQRTLFSYKIAEKSPQQFEGNATMSAVKTQRLCSQQMVGVHKCIIISRQGQFCTLILQDAQYIYIHTVG